VATNAGCRQVEQDRLDACCGEAPAVLIHFWSASVEEAELGDWDPDADPTRFSSGVGHNLFELFVRMRAAGLPVELGARSSRSVDVVVVAAPSLFWESPQSLPSALSAVARARGRVILIRSDVPLDWTFPIRPLVEVMPNQASITRTDQAFLPPLPQRGLLARDPCRGDRILRLALKTNPENVPAEVEDGSLASALSEVGVELWLDSPSAADGSDHAWHDFRSVDAALCWRRRSGVDDSLRKPATKLINAWNAGCIPFVSPEPAYLELATDGEDAVIAADVVTLVDGIRRINADPGRARMMFAACRERGSELSPEAVAALWATHLEEWTAVATASRARALAAYGYRLAYESRLKVRPAVSRLRSAVSSR
jgi:hypothetical protein